MGLKTELRNPKILILDDSHHKNHFLKTEPLKFMMVNIIFRCKPSINIKVPFLNINNIDIIHMKLIFLGSKVPFLTQILESP